MGHVTQEYNVFCRWQSW